MLLRYNMKKTIFTYTTITLIFCLLAVAAKSQTEADFIRAEADSLRVLGYSLRENDWALEESIEVYRRALDKYIQIGARDGQEAILWQIGVSYYYMSKYKEALEHFEQNLQILRDLGDRKNESFTLNYIGLVYKSISDYPKALDYYEKSLNIRRELGDLQGEAMTLSNIGVVYVRLHDFDRALEYYFKSLEIRRQLGDKLGLAQTLNNIGIAYDDLLEYSRAIQYYEQSLAISRELGNKRLEAQVLNNLGVTCYHCKDNLRAIEYYQQGLNIFREINDLKAVGLTFINIGQAYSNLKEFSTAKDYFDKAVESQRAMRDTTSLSNSYDAMGDWYDIQGMDSLAVEHYFKAIDILENIRDRLEVEAHKSSYASGTHDIYERTALALARMGRVEEAFDYVERSRARTFLDLLGGGNVQVGKARHQEFLKQKRTGTETGEYEPDNSDDSSRIKYSARGIILPKDQEEELFEPELTSMVSVSSLKLKEVQDLIDDRSVLIEYFLTGEKTLIWKITRNDFMLFESPVSGDSIEAMVTTFRAAIVSLGDTEFLANRLYLTLIAPFEKSLDSDYLTIVPHGILHYLPFAALEDERGRPLIKKYRINYLPSASVLKYLAPKRRNGGERLLAFGNPANGNPDFPPLPHSENEVRRIGEYFKNNEIYIGAEASESKFKRLAGDFDILHLACHSDLNSAYPMFSGLRLAPGDNEDGELDTHELFTMELGASLVTLSACQTGLGKLTSGDELVGLARAFFYAGTPSLVSSLWMVEDESTEFLMEHFYNYLNKYDKAESLRKAQLDTRKKFRNPRSWASFELIGDPCKLKAPSN